MIPSQITFIPLFIIMTNMHLTNSLNAFMLLQLFNAFAIFMMRQKMMTINDAYIEAAVIDGASMWRIFFKIILPMSGSAMATLAILAFMDMWNDYLLPLVLLSERSKFTLPLLLSTLSGQYKNQYNLTMAGALISIIPILIVYLAYGRKFAYEVPSVTNGIEKKMDLISYEQYQFDWAKDYLLEGSLESVQTDLGTGLIVYNSQNTIQIGDTVSLNTNGQSKEIQIVGMLSDCPFYSAAGVGTIICSEDTFEQITGESKYTVIDVQLVKGTTDEDVYVIRQMVDSSFTFADERMGNSSTMGTYYCFWLFIYGFLVLIAMITIFNIINSISMSVSARLKQYGAFRAIGVSMGQLSKMIVAEAFTYTIIGGVVGTVLGLFCNKLLFGMLISYRWGDAWTPPLPEVAVILLIVISSVILAVHGPIKRIRNMSIVDTISAQ